MRYTLKHLEYFVAAAEMGGIKPASARINISPPSISSAISHLERELQVQLFVRQRAHGLALTSSGTRMLREAKLVLRQAEGLYALAGELRNEVRGRLAIGCMVTLAPMIAPELGHAFSGKHPGVDLAITVGSHEQLLSDLRRVEIDAAISYDLDFPDDVAFEPLANLPAHILLGRDHPLAKRKSVKLAELDGQPMILLDLPYSRQYFLSIFQNEGLVANIYAKSSDQEVVRAMVANGYGYAIANVRPRSSVTLDGHELVAVRLAGTHKPMRIGVATLLQEHKPMLLEAFERHCRAMISDKSIPGMMPLRR